MRAILVSCVLLSATSGRAFDDPAAPPAAGSAASGATADGQIVLGGQIVVDDGDPVADARIELMHELPGNQSHFVAETTTDAAGRWRLLLDEAAYNIDLRVHHSEYIDFRFGWIVDPPEHELRNETAVTRLERGTAVSVNVTANGAPVAGARLLVGWLAQEENAVLTNEAGEARLNGLPSARHDVTVFAEGWAPQVASVDTTGGGADLAITLDRGATLSGEVVDEEGKPIADASVWQVEWTVSDSHFLKHNAKTDSDGRFQLPLLPRKGTVTMQISRPGYLEISTPPMVTRESAYHFVLPLPTIIEGTVVDDATGASIEQFEISEGRVWSKSQSYRLWRRLPQAESPVGKFRSELRWSAPPYPGYLVRINAPGYLPHQTAMRMVGEPGDAIEVRLRRAPPIEGTVVGTNGEPAVGAQVAWISAGYVAYVHGLRISDSSNRPEYIVPTDDAGNFVLPPSEREATLLVLHADGYAIRENALHDLDRRIALTPWSRVEFALRTGAERSRTASVGLSPVDDRWTNPDARVRFTLHAVADAEGNAAIEHVPSIPVRAGWFGRGILSHATTLTPEPGKTHVVELGTHGSVVSGRIANPADLPLPPFTTESGVHRYLTQIVAVPKDQLDLPGLERTNYMAVVEPDGAFLIRGVPPGDYELMAQVFPPQLINSCALPIPLARATAPLHVPTGETEVALPRIQLVAVRGPLPGDALPDLPPETLSGEAIDWDALRGKVVVLDFWASWCGPCLAAVPLVRDVLDEHRDEGLTVIGVNIDSLSESALKAIEEHDMHWEHLAFGAWGEDNPLLRELGVSNIPSLWIVGPDGTVLARDVPADQLADAVRQALGR